MAQIVRDLAGKRFGKLVAVSLAEKTDNGRKFWYCNCDCGNNTVVRSTSLVSGNTTSCGCVRGKPPTRHGMIYSPEYRAWQGMKDRCFNADSHVYKYYGGRGIIVCEEWRNSFEAFYAHVGKRPSDEHSLDRINNNGNYEPGNVRWATRYQQNYNRRRLTG